MRDKSDSDDRARLNNFARQCLKNVARVHFFSVALGALLVAMSIYGIKSLEKTQEMAASLREYAAVKSAQSFVETLQYNYSYFAQPKNSKAFDLDSLRFLWRSMKLQAKQKVGDTLVLEQRLFALLRSPELDSLLASKFSDNYGSLGTVFPLPEFSELSNWDMRIALAAVISERIERGPIGRVYYIDSCCDNWEVALLSVFFGSVPASGLRQLNASENDALEIFGDELAKLPAKELLNYLKTREDNFKDIVESYRQLASQTAVRVPVIGSGLGLKYAVIFYPLYALLSCL